MKPRLLLIDNYDSFTYNLVQAFLVLGADVSVYRNDAISDRGGARARAHAPVHLPGPGTPYDAGVSMDMIRAFAGRIPVLGVCLGHQSIVEVFGGKVVRAGRLMHGKTSPIEHDGRTLFAGLPQPCEVGRYHSLIASPREHAGAAGGQRAHRGRGDHGGAPPRARWSRGCSSIRRASSRPTARACWAISWACPRARAPARTAPERAVSHPRETLLQLLERRRPEPVAGRGAAHAAGRSGTCPRRSPARCWRRCAPRAWSRRRCAASRRRCAVSRAARICRPTCAPSTSSAPAGMPRAA